MILLVLLLAIAGVVALGAAYEWHIKRHLPHDLREVTTHGLPSEASIRSGELGLGVGSQAFRSFPGSG
jgi:hypothetical protein